jgi:FkbM family methyltransferase
VGANVGQTALKFRIAFPKAKIYCFEPVKKTFEILKRKMNSYNTISCYQIAFGSSKGQETIYLTDQSNTSSLLKPDKKVGSEVVNICTVDGFALDNQIKRIDLLKIDTEGFDLEVLKGAQNMLSSGQIAFVLTEIGFHPGDARHVLFDEIRSYLLPMGYAVFGIYDQQLEWSGEKRLRYANVCFSKESAFIYK